MNLSLSSELTLASVNAAVVALGQDQGVDS